MPLDTIHRNVLFDLARAANETFTNDLEFKIGRMQIEEGPKDIFSMSEASYGEITVMPESSYHEVVEIKYRPFSKDRVTCVTYSTEYGLNFAKQFTIAAREKFPRLIFALVERPKHENINLEHAADSHDG